MRSEILSLHIWWFDCVYALCDVQVEYQLTDQLIALFYSDFTNLRTIH